MRALKLLFACTAIGGAIAGAAHADQGSAAGAKACAGWHGCYALAPVGRPAPDASPATGTRLPTAPVCAAVPGVTRYSLDDIRNTGQTSLGPALRLLDPRMR